MTNKLTVMNCDILENVEKKTRIPRNEKVSEQLTEAFTVESALPEYCLSIMDRDLIMLSDMSLLFEQNKDQEIIEIPDEIKNLKVTYLFVFSDTPPLPSKGNEDVLVIFLQGHKFKYRYLFSIDRKLPNRRKSYSIKEVLKDRKIVEYMVHKIYAANIKLVSAHLKTP